MRIAWITYDFEEYSTLHVNAMSADHEVLLVIPRAEDGEPTYWVDPTVETCIFDKPRLREPLQQYRSVKSILNEIDQFEPDVVHFQQGHLWFNWALAALKKRYPLVITIHDPKHHAGDTVSQKTPQWVMDHGFRKAEHAIVHGQALIGEVTERFGLPKDQVHVIPHVAMGQMESKPTTNAAEDPNLILFFGRIYNYKGLMTLIQAQPRISEACPDAKIMIAGQGDDFDKYRNAMADPSKFIVHNDWISDEERAEFFQQAAMVVLPYNEATQSGVVPVAYNFLKPVVATKVGALSECVDDRQTGLLVPPRDSEKLADAIIQLLRDPECRLAMGQNGFQKLQAECSAEVVARQTVNVYEAALRDRGLCAADDFRNSEDSSQETNQQDVPKVISHGRQEASGGCV